ncbi:MAG: DEAD/DEAH box helicase [Planctomycetaceae bacterium]|nr:DEAD/DEAH box helicase [Planctomycetaceae bacterium]
MQLRPYQQAAIDAVYNHLRARDTNPCVVLPTASGKTPLLATICSDAVKRWNGRVLILAHVKELLQQAADKLQLICPDVKVGVYSAGLKSREIDAPVIVAGIQSVYKRACELDRFDLILVDEAHLLPPDGEGMYQTFLKDAKVVNPHVRLIGLTATPYRLKSGILVGSDCLLNEICYEIGIKELIEQGFLCPLKSKSGRQKVDCSDLHVRAGEFVASEVDELINTPEHVLAACREIISKTQDRNSVLIFAASVDHAKNIKVTIETLTNGECGLVTGDTPSDERERILRRFKGEVFAKDLLGGETKPLKYLANVNVLTTGFDSPNIDCVVLLRPTASPGLYYQMCLDMETEVLTPLGWRRCHEIAKGDPVGTFNMVTGEIVYAVAEEKTHRSLRHDESMYGIRSPRLDIRVTNNHNMVVRCKSTACKRWQLQTAEHIATRCEGYYIPVAGHGDLFTSEAGLSDAEVAFLGWYLTDGYRNHHTNTITISQSVAKFYNEIQRVLTECGFGFRTYRQKRKGKLEHYQDNLLFVVPHGSPRCEQAGKTGWEHLAEWIDKDVPAIYDTLSKRQFKILLQAMDLANGRHRKTLDYVSRTMTINLGCRQRLADRIQQLAILRGLRCDVHCITNKPSAWNKTPQKQWSVAIKEMTTTFVGGTRQDKNTLGIKRSLFTAVPHEANEWVWCLTTENHTLVTRRNGKVAIVGNCGRGFRLHESKTNCLVLDYGGNILRHGPVDAIHVKDKREKGVGTAPAKECPQCQALIHAALAVCPDCGFEFPPPERSTHDENASNEGILTGEVVDAEYDVQGIYYSPHIKRGASEGDPKTLRVDYQIGFNDIVSEWVTPEHGGWARKKFEKWWTDRSNDPPPDTADLAVRIAKAGGLAETNSIVVRKVTGEHFNRIIKYSLGEKPAPVSENLAPVEVFNSDTDFLDDDVPF